MTIIVVITAGLCLAWLCLLKSRLDRAEALAMGQTEPGPRGAGTGFSQEIRLARYQSAVILAHDAGRFSPRSGGCHVLPSHEGLGNRIRDLILERDRKLVLTGDAE
jgi:hypothetical protein